MCGTFGCILPDRHAGLHQFGGAATGGARKRKAPTTLDMDESVNATGARHAKKARSPRSPPIPPHLLAERARPRSRAAPPRPESGAAKPRRSRACNTSSGTQPHGDAWHGRRRDADVPKGKLTKRPPPSSTASPQQEKKARQWVTVPPKLASMGADALSSNPCVYWSPPEGCRPWVVTSHQPHPRPPSPRGVMPHPFPTPHALS